MSEPTSLSRLIDSSEALAAGRRYPITDDWLQGRTCFGGLVAALGAHAMRTHAGAGWPAQVGLAALQASFVGPVAPGTVELQVRVLRQGRSVCQVQATALQGDAVAAAFLAVFAAPRESALTPRRPQRPPVAHEADALPAPPDRAGTLPAFLSHFDLRWAEGPPPFSGGRDWHTRIHLRLKADEAATLPTELQAVLLADLAPTPVIGQLRAPAANSSVTWALELRPVAPTPADGWWRADNESVMVDGGYVNHSARLWAPDGAIAAFGQQLVAVFA